MKSGKIIVLVIILILAAVGSILILYIPSVREGDFRIDDTSAVVSFSIRAESEIDLTRKGGNWIINNEIRANRQAVGNFLYFFKNLEITGMRKAEENLTDEGSQLRIDLGRKSINLRVIEAEEGIYLHHPGSDRMYSVRIPGNPDARLADIFSSSLIYWQDKLLLSIQPDEIAEITVKPSGPWKTGFTLKNENGIPDISDERGNIPDPEDFNQEKAIMYFSYFTAIYFEEVLNTDIEHLSLFFRIKIKSRSGTENSLEIYKLPGTDGKDDIFNALVRFNSGRTAFRLNYSQLDLLLEDYESFLKN